MKFSLVLIGISFLWSLSSPARVFDISKQTVGTYLRGVYGLGTLKKSPYGNASGTSTQFSESFGANTGGEFGFYMSSGEFGFRLGVESVSPKKLSGISGVNSSGGAELMTLDSSVSATIYKGAIEYSLFIDPQSKFFFHLGLGSAQVKMINDYNLTAAGSTLYSVSSHKEEATATVIMGELGAGYEYNFGSDTTVLLDIGYRQLNVKRLKHKSSITSFNPGATEGSVVQNGDGSNRSLNMSGLWIGFGFRFYINYF